MSAPTPTLSVALKLARRELRGGIKGFRIFLACLALGVAAIASVQSVSSGILTGLRNDGQRLLGGDLAIRTLYQGLSEDQLDYLERSSETVSHFAEMRSMVRQTDGDSTLVELKAVDAAYPLFGTVRLEGERELQYALDKRGGVWGTVIEPTLLDRLQVQPGERLLLGEQEYEIRGVIREEPDRVGWSGTFGLGPRMMVALDSLPGTGLVQKGSLVYQHYRLRLPPGTDLGRYQSELNAAFPEANWRLRDYREAAPRIQRVVDRLTLFLTLVGLTALLVGGVGISNAVRAYLDNKLAVIATLKCVGAPGRTVFQTYMAQILILAAGGIGIGLIVGAAAPLLAGRLLQDWLPFAVQMGLYPGALLLAAVFGLLTTLSFAIWPLARAHGIPAAALFRSIVEHDRSRPKTPYILATGLSGLLLSGLAVASAEHRPFAAWFVIGAIAAMLAFRLAAWGVMTVTARLRRPRHPGLRLAVSNLHRPGSPTPSVVLSLGLGLSVLVAIVLIEGNMGRQIQESIPERAPSFFFIDIQRDQIKPFTELVSSLEGVRDVQEVPYLRGRIVAINGVPAEQAMVDRDHEWMIRGDRGLTYSATRPENAEIVAGEWWPEDYAGPPLLSIHQDVTEAFGIGLGDTITLNVLGRDITGTVANVRALEWQSLQINFAIMLSPEPLRHAPHSFIATLSVEPAAELKVQSEVARRFPNVTAVRIKEALDTINELLRDIGVAVRSIASVTLIAGTLVLAGAIAAGHRKRVYDSVVLKVLGATRKDVLRAFLMEYGLLGLVTASIAALVGTVTSWAVMTQVMETDWTFIPAAVLATTLLCTLITLSLGFIGTWRALGQKAAPLLRND